jgi:hypothetical protein
MKKRLILIPALVGAMLMQGCSTPAARYLPFPLSLAGGASFGRVSYDDGGSYQDDGSAAREASEEVSRMDDWQNEQNTMQAAATATQESEAATQEASDAAAASAAVGIGQ